MTNLISANGSGNHPRDVFEFGCFKLDLGKRLLLRDGMMVHLKPKVFDLLLLLLESDGNLLTKEQLMQKLWPDHFVEEGNLNVTVFSLRKALKDNGDQHRYIQTIPRIGYRFSCSVKRSTPTDPGSNGWPAAAASFANSKSIAVLPLIISPDLGDEYLGLGLADALITRLSALKKIQVRPTSSVRLFAGEKRDPVEIGRRLSVDFILEGNIRKIGDRLRVTTQLVSVTNGAILWAERFDEWLTDIFVTEDLLSRKVANALAIEITKAENERLTKRHTVSPEAYRAYMKGRFFWMKRTHAGLKRSIQYFKEAIKLDPEYAQPYVGMADAHFYLGSLEAQPAKPAFIKAEQLVLEALDRDRDLVEAHTSLALLRMVKDWNWSEAEDEFNQAIQINSNYPLAHQWYSVLLRHQGRYEDAMREVDRALQLDPVSAMITTSRALIFFFSRNHDVALDEFERAFELDGNYPIGHFGKALCCLELNRYDESLAELEIVRKSLTTWSAEVTSIRTCVYARCGNSIRANELHEELLSHAKQEHVPPYYVAKSYLALGEVERALNFLELAFKQRDPEMSPIAVDPHMDPLRSDQRFTSLLQRMGLSATANEMDARS